MPFYRFSNTQRGAYYLGKKLGIRAVYDPQTYKKNDLHLSGEKMKSRRQVRKIEDLYIS